jgi:hypothetical protein
LYPLNGKGLTKDFCVPLFDSHWRHTSRTNITNSNYSLHPVPVERKERGGEVTAGGPAQSRTNSLDSVANSFQDLPAVVKFRLLRTKFCLLENMFYSVNMLLILGQS